MIESLLHDESGLTTVEYAMMLAVMVVAGIVAWQTLGGEVRNSVDEASANWPGAREGASTDMNGG